MLRPLVRSLLSAVVATCFALSALSMGRPLECASHSAAGGHERPPSHGHAPSPPGCAVHLCCAHLAPGESATLAVMRVVDGPGASGLVPVAAIRVARPSHSLPFALAPPRTIA